jgi:hypothetical protein
VVVVMEAAGKRAGRPRTTKTLAWRESDQAVLRALRAQVVALRGEVWSERDVVGAALRLALRDPAGLIPPRTAA